jgi:hypothetical protein
LLFAETELGCEVPFVTATTAGLANTPTIGAVFPAATFTLTSALAGLAVAVFTDALAPGTVDEPFAPPEIELTFAFPATGFAEACTETAFWVEAAGFVPDVALTETAGFVFGVTLAALAFAPFGDGLPACVLLVAGCTLTVAGAGAGFCTAVGVCANAAADRSMSVPRVRII